ncbi:hypothetical protein KM043_002332 [Ampulex compressa]|nr:hypothetical protein KM043_002332 [Ampulex compressa]
MTQKPRERWGLPMAESVGVGGEIAWRLGRACVLRRTWAPRRLGDPRPRESAGRCLAPAPSAAHRWRYTRSVNARVGGRRENREAPPPPAGHSPHPNPAVAPVREASRAR